MKIRLTKISDNKFNGSHPNGIFEGSVHEGNEVTPLKVGERYMGGGLYTSTVTEIIDETTFKTKNSTYKREVID